MLVVAVVVLRANSKASRIDLFSAFLFPISYEKNVSCKQRGITTSRFL